MGAYSHKLLPAEVEARIVRTAKAEPELGLEVLSKRFGVSTATVRRVLVAAGLRKSAEVPRKARSAA
jgi:DeoR/GlpR family transcriptional regulator of sugar metabolism